MTQKRREGNWHYLHTYVYVSSRVLWSRYRTAQHSVLKKTIIFLLYFFILLFYFFFILYTFIWSYTKSSSFMFVCFRRVFNVNLLNIMSLYGIKRRYSCFRLFSFFRFVEMSFCSVFYVILSDVRRVECLIELSKFCLIYIQNENFIASIKYRFWFHKNFFY